MNISNYEYIKNHSASINTHTVYYMLKKLSPQTLRQLFHDRQQLMTNTKMVFVQNCYEIEEQTNLMFN